MGFWVIQIPGYSLILNSCYQVTWKKNNALHSSQGQQSNLEPLAESTWKDLRFSSGVLQPGIYRICNSESHLHLLLKSEIRSITRSQQSCLPDSCGPNLKRFATLTFMWHPLCIPQTPAALNTCYHLTYTLILARTEENYGSCWQCFPYR